MWKFRVQGLTMELAKIRESQGKVAEAATILQELQVDTVRVCVCMCVCMVYVYMSICLKGPLGLLVLGDLVQVGSCILQALVSHHCGKPLRGDKNK